MKALMLILLFALLSTSIYAQREVEILQNGIVLPRLWQGQRDALNTVEGHILYNLSTNKISVYDGLGWQEYIGPSLWVKNASHVYYSAGRVGIGVANPDHQLSVHTNSSVSYIRVSDASTGTTSGLRLGLNGAGNAYIINDAFNKNLNLGTSGSTKMRIDELGHVSININPPNQMLHIRQDAANKCIRIQHQLTTDYWENGIGTTTKNYKFYFNNLFRADISSIDGSYTQTSDRKLKHNIEAMDEVLSRVSQLKPLTYQYKDNPENSVRSTGFIAQDVKPLFPELVRDMDDEYLGLVYDGFAVVSIKAIQELYSMISEMQAEIETLKKEIEK
jgi:hypothetical protein